MSEEKAAADRAKPRAHYSSVKDATIWGASFIAFVAVLIMLLLLLSLLTTHTDISFDLYDIYRQ